MLLADGQHCHPERRHFAIDRQNAILDGIERYDEARYTRLRDCRLLGNVLYRFSYYQGAAGAIHIIDTLQPCSNLSLT